MMPTSIPVFQLATFTDSTCKGNPASVCVLAEWLDTPVLQAIACENNQSETAFICPESEGYGIRWFTPQVEVDLCGHATLASAAVVFRRLGYDGDRIVFNSVSGVLTVTRDTQNGLWLDFPARPAVPVAAPDILAQALGATPLKVLQARDLLVELPNEDAVRQLQPNFHLISQIKSAFAVIVTAKGAQVDFVSRFFAPNAGLPEDPVTGSAHCTLAPYWAQRLGKTTLSALQVSSRGGALTCCYQGSRVLIGGHVRFYMQGHLYPQALGLNL